MQQNMMFLLETTLQSCHVMRQTPLLVIRLQTFFRGLYRSRWVKHENDFKRYITRGCEIEYFECEHTMLDFGIDKCYVLSLIEFGQITAWRSERDQGQRNDEGI